MIALPQDLRQADDVYITDELYSRLPKSTDYEREKSALQDLAGQMIGKPAEVLPRLVDLAIELCGGVSGGISIYETDPAPGIFRWHHLRGDLAQFTGGTTPRDYSPCGVTLDNNKAILARHPERFYKWLGDANIALAECLLVPLFVGGKEPLGTIWIVSKDEGHFDSGHARVMTELAQFAGIALAMVQAEQRLKLALEQQEHLTQEMSHRVKNTFAIASGLIRLSARDASTPAEMSENLSGRMEALAAANALVRRSFDDNEVAEETELGELVRKILRPHARLDGSGFIIEGPLVQLGTHATNGMALVLHELATNSAKYGALKSADGMVSVKWLDVEGLLSFDWIESGATAPTATPLKTGFGTKLSEATIIKQFGGKILYRWNPAGLAVAIKLQTTRLAR